MTAEEFVNKYVKKIYREKYLNAIKSTVKPEFGAKYLNKFSNGFSFYTGEMNKNIEKDDIYHPHLGYGVELIYEGNDDIDWAYSLEETSPIYKNSTDYGKKI